MLAVAPSLLDAIHGDLHRPRVIVHDRQERPCIGGDGGGGFIIIIIITRIALRRIEQVRVDQRRILPWSDPRVLHAIEQHAVEHHEHPEAVVRLRATRLRVASLAVEEVVLVDGGALAPHPRRDRQPVLAAHADGLIRRRVRRRELGHPSARAVEVESRARVADSRGSRRRSGRRCRRWRRRGLRRRRRCGCGCWRRRRSGSGRRGSRHRHGRCEEQW